MVQKVADRGVVLENGVLIADAPIAQAVARLRGRSA